MQGYGPNILHLIDDATLLAQGLSEGDVIHLKQNSLQWWNHKLESKKRKQPDQDVGGPAMPIQPQPELHAPPNIKVQFKKRFHDEGAARLYGP